MFVETLGELSFPQVQVLLESSRKFHEANNIPMHTARWERRSYPQRLILDMVTLPVNQGHAEIGHGGFISGLIDDTAGFAAVAWAAERGKTVLGKELRSVRFKKPLPLYTIVRVVGMVDEVRGSTIVSNASVMRLDNDHVIAEGELVAKLVDAVRVP